MQRAIKMFALIVLFLAARDVHSRTWTDSTGNYTVEADYLDCQDGKVQLRRTDNQKIVSLPIERLSRGGQELIRSLRRAPKAGDKLVTQRRTVLHLGEKIVARVAAGIELAAVEVQLPWIGVVVEQEGRSVAGWIPAIELGPLVNGSPPQGQRPIATMIAPVSRRVEHVDEADFEQQVLRAEVPVLVDFCAEWCGPCRALGPVLEELAGEAAGARIVKVDFDRNRTLATRYGVQSLPSLLVFKRGQLLGRQVGAAAKDRLKSMLNL